MRNIHPTAIVDPKAEIGEDVEIGPFCVVGPHVTIEDGCRLASHVSMAGRTRLGAGSKVFPFAALGHDPQHVRYKGEPSTLTFGKRCLIREGATAHLGTEFGGMTTVIGDDCMLFANAHVAHDCRIENNVLLLNNVMLAGHCAIGAYAILSGGVGVHQFCRIGRHAFIGAVSMVENDVIPYGMVLGNRAHLAGLNIVGLKRRGFAREQIHELRRAYRLLFAEEGTLLERLEDVREEFAQHALVTEIVEFIRAGGDRSLCTPRQSSEP